MKCTNCGAPLNAQSSTQIITCEYCGFPQERVNAEKYMEQIKAEMYSWMRSMMPVGIQATAQADPIARSHLFEQVIRPRLAQELNSLRMQLIRLGAGYLVAPPFVTLPERPFSIDSKTALNAGAKFAGLSELAITEEQIAFINDAITTAEVLGYLTNSMKLTVSRTERNYKILAKNFESIIESLNRTPSKVATLQRAKGLQMICNAMVSLSVQGDPNGAMSEFEQAERFLGDAERDISKEAGALAWLAGIRSEKTICASLKTLSLAANSMFRVGERPASLLAKLEHFVMVFESAKAQSSSMFASGRVVDPNVFGEICSSFSDVILAKTGERQVNVLSGYGNVWIPCWYADMTYSFETGVWRFKKGQSVQERLLVSGNSTLYPQWITQGTRYLVSDIFSVGMESTFWDRMQGRETSLTSGIGYSALAEIRRSTIPPSAVVIPPVTSKQEAEKIAEMYISQVRNRLLGKLKIGVPTVTQLVYVVGPISNGYLQVPGLPGSMQLYVGNDPFLTSYAL